MTRAQYILLGFVAAVAFAAFIKADKLAGLMGQPTMLRPNNQLTT